MTTSMDERREAFERKFAHDEMLRFKARARRDRLFGLWAAELLGRKDGLADVYARGVVAADFIEPGDEAVFEKVRADLRAGGLALADAAIRDRMSFYWEEAIRQLMYD